jgi:hypothetical protein
MKKIFYLVLVLILFITSCQKDIVFVPGSGPGNGSAGGTKNPSADGLSGTTWKIVASTSVVEDNGMSFDVNLFDLFIPCQIDNTVTYNANFTATSDEGPTKCDPSTPQTQTGGKWSLSSDKKTFVVDFPLYMGMSSLSSEVLQLDNNTFKIRYVTFVNGPKATTTTTYSRVK